MYKKILSVVAVSASLMFNASVFAESAKCGEELKNIVTSALKLDETQKEKVKPVLEQLKTTLKERGTQMQDIRAKLKAQVESDTMDQTTVDGLIDQKTKVLGEMMKARITARHDVYMLLNPEQKTKLKSEMQKIEDKWAAKFKSCHDEG